MLSSRSLSHDSNIPKDISFLFFFFSFTNAFLGICHITTWQIQCHNWIEKTLLCFYNLCCLAWAWYNLSLGSLWLLSDHYSEWERPKLKANWYTHVVIAWNLVPPETPLLRQRLIDFHSVIDGKFQIDMNITFIFNITILGYNRDDMFLDAVTVHHLF